MTDDATAITTVEAAIRKIGVNTSVDELADTIGKLDGLGRRVKELKALFEDAMLARIQESGEVVVGDIRYYAGQKKTTRCTDPAATLEAWLAALGGDVAAVAAGMTAQPWKHGAARSVLPAEDYGRLFVTEEELELREGKPIKRLLIVNTGFVS